ncbi:MAG: universal stress protein [Acidobacteria bacterium]|nr:MAG: universal stress protein [Acidobacteriota bacterium]
MPSTPETILVPLDGSDLARRALPLASSLAERLDAKLVLFSVAQPSGLEFVWCGEAALPLAGEPGAAPAEELAEEAERVARAHLEAEAARLRGEGREVECRIGRGEPAPAITATADETGALLVVMATHGRGGVSRWALGSVADKVLRRASCPVLLVRAGMARVGGPPRRILVPLDGSRAAESVLPIVTRLAAACASETVLAHVLPDLRRLSWGHRGEGGRAMEERYRRWAETYLGETAERLRREGIEARTEILGGADVAEALLARQEAGDIDMLALSTHGRGGLDRWAFGSVADRLVRAGGIPVLATRMPPDADNGAP